MKSYLFSYTPEFGSTDQVLAWLDRRIEVARWMTPPMPSSVIILSDLPVFELGRIIQGDFPHKFYTLIELNSQTVAGCLPKMVWAEINRGILLPSNWQQVFGPGGILEREHPVKQLE